MILTARLAEAVVTTSKRHLGREFVYEKFNCVHFIRSVYEEVGIALPLLDRFGYPPSSFHLSDTELVTMPLGHSLFLKRRLSQVRRFWTHVALIVSAGEVIHCSRHFGKMVTITPIDKLWEIYALAPKPPP